MKKRLDSSRELMKVCFSCHLDMTVFSVLLTFFSASLPHFGHWRLKTCFDLLIFAASKSMMVATYKCVGKSTHDKLMY